MKGLPRESDGGAEVVSQRQSDGAPARRRFGCSPKTFFSFGGYPN